MDTDPVLLEFLLNGEPLPGSLLAAARAMEGVEFFHGTRRRTMTFSFALVEPALIVCLEWAEVHGPDDARQALGIQQLAAVRAWTATVLCYVLTSVLRKLQRTRETVQPVLPYARLFFTALHSLPEQYIVQDATLYRAECGVMETWDVKMRAPDGIFSFDAPTSFSLNPAVLKGFKGEGPRTVYEVWGAAGYRMRKFSPFDEDEVLLEPVCHFQVRTAEKFDEHHRDVLMGEVRVGLHRVEGSVRPGFEMLGGSPVKEREIKSYQDMQKQIDKKCEEDRREENMDLAFYPFTEEEWMAKGKVVPKKDKERKMSVLGKGAFMITYRMKTKTGVVRCFAVKVVEREEMQYLGITEEDVRREARTLARMRHKYVIRYYGWEESEEEMGIIMEIAQGGSLADLIKTRANGNGVQTGEVIEMMLQIACAMEYIHMQGIVHRDIKTDNILLAHAEGSGPLLVKLADFGVAVVLATVSGSACISLSLSLSLSLSH